MAPGSSTRDGEKFMSLTIKNQGKLAGIALAAGLAVTAFGTGTALAASPAEDCAAAGGTYTAAGPDSTCTIAGTPVGNSDNTKGGSTELAPASRSRTRKRRSVRA
jgi:hypothetical protein